MKRMRMSEVFDLPVASNQVYISPNLIERNKEKGVSNSDALEHAAHAINNCDSLADALAAALPSLQYNRSISDSADRIYTDAVLALQAYRGTK